MNFSYPELGYYIINTAYCWYPDFANLLRLERLAKQIGLSAMDFAELIKGKVLNFTGRLFSSEHNRWFASDNTPLQILRDNDRRLTLTANRIPINQWFSEQYDKLRQSILQPIQPKKNRGMKLQTTMVTAIQVVAIVVYLLSESSAWVFCAFTCC